jgi:hypothetical protein
MFGLVRPYMNDLTEEEKARYKAVYCGLCRALNEKYGLAGRMGLNYDMTFLIILLDSLYEPQEQTKDAFCPPHPVKKHRETKSEFTDYAADMTVALTYYKALDDWMDEGSKTGKVYSGLLKRSYQQVKERWPNAEDMPQQLRDDFRRGSLPLMKYTNLLTFNSRAILIYITCLLNVPYVYPLVEITIYSLLYWHMHRTHERLCQSFSSKCW